MQEIKGHEFNGVILRTDSVISKRSSDFYFCSAKDLLRFGYTNSICTAENTGRKIRKANGLEPYAKIHYTLVATYLNLDADFVFKRLNRVL